MDSIIKCTHTCIFSHALWYLLKCQCVCVCIWSCLCSVTFDIYNTSWCVHVWPPRAIGGDVVRCVGSLASLSRSVLIKPRLGRSAGAGIIYQNWEGFYALSIQRVLCLPSCSRLRCKLARRRRRLSRVHIVVWPVFFFFFTEQRLCPTALPPCWSDSSCEWLLGPKWQAPEIGLDRVRGLLPRRWRRKNTQKQRKNVGIRSF